MGRCVLLNFKLPWSIAGLELRLVSTHPRFMRYLGLAQCHVWAVTGLSSSQELGLRLPSPLIPVETLIPVLGLSSVLWSYQNQGQLAGCRQIS